MARPRAFRIATWRLLNLGAPEVLCSRFCLWSDLREGHPGPANEARVLVLEGAVDLNGPVWMTANGIPVPRKELGSLKGPQLTEMKNPNKPTKHCPGLLEARRAGLCSEGHTEQVLWREAPAISRDGGGPAARGRACLGHLSPCFLDCVCSQSDRLPRVIADHAHGVPFMAWPPFKCVWASCPYASPVEQLASTGAPVGCAVLVTAAWQCVPLGGAGRGAVVRPRAAGRGWSCLCGGFRLRGRRRPPG